MNELHFFRVVEILFLKETIGLKHLLTLNVDLILYLLLQIYQAITN